MTCVVSHLDAGGSAEADVVLVEPAGDALAGSTSEASISASQFDPTPSNDSGEATAPMPAPGAPTADLAIQDHESSSQDTLGGTLIDTITVVNNGPGTATGVDLTDALDAAAQVIAIDPGAFTCSSGAAVQCSLAELAPGASETLEVDVRPLRPGQLIDDVTASDDQFDPNYANDSAKTTATVTTTRTAAKVRIVPVQPVASPGHVVGFVVTVGVIKPIPGVKPTVCVTLPRQLRVIRAPGAVAGAGRLCWDADALVNGSPRTFRFSARIVSSSDRRHSRCTPRSPVRTSPRAVPPPPSRCRHGRSSRARRAQARARPAESPADLAAGQSPPPEPVSGEAPAWYSPPLLDRIRDFSRARVLAEPLACDAGGQYGGPRDGASATPVGDRPAATPR